MPRQFIRYFMPWGLRLHMNMALGTSARVVIKGAQCQTKYRRIKIKACQQA